MTALLTVVLMLTMLAGCGTNANEIAFSELFEGDVIVYGCGKVDKDASVNISVYKTDGSYTVYDSSDLGSNLGKFAQESDSDILSTLETTDVDVYGEYKLGIDTDSTGNNTESETIFMHFEYRDGSGTSSNDTKYVSFEGHTTIYDSSYMVFKTDKDSYRLIRDTDKTKDKTVYFDPVGTDDIVVDKKLFQVFGE